nr:hypothetical protein [Methylobacterium sp. Leaf122]
MSRTQAKQEAVGFIRMEENQRRKVPTAVIHKLTMEIDPFSQNERLEIA